MNGIIFVPGKSCIITTSFLDDEPGRIKQVLSLLGSVDIKIIPYKEHMIYTLRKDQKSLNDKEGMYGCIVCGKNLFLGNCVIFGIDDKGNDLPCSLSVEMISSDFEICIFKKDSNIDNYI